MGLQQDVMISAAATAVGINMTFFMPFVLLRRKWGREHRGLAKFDLWTALLDTLCGRHKLCSNCC